MICPQCQTGNPDSAKFCMNCGTAFNTACSNCGSSLPANARFCMNCGQPVSATTTTDETRLSRLAAAAPAPLADKMRAAHTSGDRKVVTALFADVVGSTSLAEQMDPEDWTTIMNHAFDRVSPFIYKYEGTIARLLGDALLAFFGAPVAHEDDPIRAVRAALDILAATREYAGEVRNRYGIEFAIRIGINTGPVVVGLVGSDLKYEYTAMGDAINLAARMQSAAKPMTTLIAEFTYRFVAPVIDCVDLGLMEVKGKVEPVRVYEVTGVKAAPGRIRGLIGLESPMVGRNRELDVLRQNSHALLKGQGSAVAVIGEPGLGKSRLISEWKAQGESENGTALTWHIGQCLSYGQGLAYHLLTDVLRSLSGVTIVTDENEIQAALKSLTQELFDSSILDVYPYLGHLLSIPMEAEAQARIQTLDPQALQSHYVMALQRLLREMANRAPLCLILEDIHWADPSSTDVIIRLLPLAWEAPLSFCFVTRPDRDGLGWKMIDAARTTLSERFTEISLTTLSEADSRQLVTNLLEVEALPDAIRNIILKKAEGNPFFVEEVIRMLIDSGAITQRDNRWIAEKSIATVEIPDNLHGLLLARIDRLSEDAKRTLRIASVIGRQFPIRVLEQVLRKDEAR
jgi:class 3 adenylate cyclase